MIQSAGDYLVDLTFKNSQSKYLNLFIWKKKKMNMKQNICFQCDDCNHSYQITDTWVTYLVTKHKHRTQLLWTSQRWLLERYLACMTSGEVTSILGRMLLSFNTLNRSDTQFVACLQQIKPEKIKSLSKNLLLFLGSTASRTRWLWSSCCYWSFSAWYRLYLIWWSFGHHVNYILVTKTNVV